MQHLLGLNKSISSLKESQEPNRETMAEGANSLKIPVPINTPNEAEELNNWLTSTENKNFLVSLMLVFLRQIIYFLYIIQQTQQLYFAGGKDLSASCRNVMRQLMTNNCAEHFNWRGGGSKISFIHLHNILNCIKSEMLRI